MIKKYTYGKPFQTESVVVDIAAEKGQPDHGNIDLTAGFSYTFGLEDSDIVYGLGEANRGINKRGYKYISNNADNPHHHEDVYSLYASHNFIIVSGAQTFGLYFDYPSTITFDVGYTKCDELHIFCDSADLDIYVITGDSPYDITKQFRKMIGRSYIPPKFAFGFGQSRWGYKTPEDFETVARKYRENHIPIDMVYMDIDYMDSYKDFTINDDFGDFSEYVENLKKDNIRLIPIIDAGVKIEETSDRLHSSGQHSIQKCLLLAHALANKRHGHNCTFREVLYSDSYGKCKCTCDGHAHIAHGCAGVHNAHCHALGDIVERDCKYHHGRLLKL
jgi:alpha-glucosidase